MLAPAAPPPKPEPKHPNEALVERFWTAWQRKDGAGMRACYHPEVEFSDPVFPSLKSAITDTAPAHIRSENHAVAMWLMFCANPNPIEVTFRDIKVNNTEGTGHWEAKYTFEGNAVHNIIDTKFEFRDGLIVKQTDTFSLWNWASQALGWTGYFLGWTSMVQNAIRGKAAARLNKFIDQHPELKNN